jgi:hypothetical protein
MTAARFEKLLIAKAIIPEVKMLDPLAKLAGRYHITA